MSVRRKGPKATAVRVATYVLLVVVAIVVVFPFAVAVTTAFKRNTDIFTYPPSLVPKKEATIPAADVGLEGDPVPVYTFPTATTARDSGRSSTATRRSPSSARSTTSSVWSCST